jgi:hypothetical protein
LNDIGSQVMSASSDGNSECCCGFSLAVTGGNNDQSSFFDGSNRVIFIFGPSIIICLAYNSAILKISFTGRNATAEIPVRQCA